jgi:hypothetical protein
LSGLMLGLGITGFFALPKFVSNILAIIAIYVGYNVNTTYGEGCQQQP